MTPGAQSYLSYNWLDPEYSGGSGHISLELLVPSTRDKNI